MRWIFLLTLIPTLHAETLYSTDFESFPVGANNWSGTEGWASTDNTSGAQSIDADLFPAVALGNSATLGFTQPENQETFVSVIKFFNHDHTASGLDIIEISAFLAIADSTNTIPNTNITPRDDFFLTIYNAGGTPLASIRFDNQDPDATNSQFGIWREDGVTQFDTLVPFSHGELFEIYIEINLASNTWSADTSILPLFTDATFTSAATGSDINFGALAFEWDLTSQFPALYGDNFMAVDELLVEATTHTVQPLVVTANTDPATGHVTVSWPGDAGFDYQVLYSTNLVNWFGTLPGSRFSSVTTAGTMSFTDISSPGDRPAFYQVIRTESSGDVTPLSLASIRDPETGHVTLSWPGEVGSSYQLQFSTDLEHWSDTLPGSTFSNLANTGTLTYTDTTNTGTAMYYQVVRTALP